MASGGVFCVGVRWGGVWVISSVSWEGEQIARMVCVVDEISYHVWQGNREAAYTSCISKLSKEQEAWYHFIHFITVHAIISVKVPALLCPHSVQRCCQTAYLCDYSICVLPVLPISTGTSPIIGHYSSSQRNVKRRRLLSQGIFCRTQFGVTMHWRRSVGSSSVTSHQRSAHFAHTIRW